MLLASSFMLNHTTEREQWTLHPWLLNSCNHVTDADQLQAVHVPDLHPGEIIRGPHLLSMAAGDFLDCYGDAGSRGAFDAVVTCFFIDTAHNVVAYMQTIWEVLKVGLQCMHAPVAHDPSHVHRRRNTARRVLDQPGPAALPLGRQPHLP